MRIIFLSGISCLLGVLVASRIGWKDCRMKGFCMWDIDENYFFAGNKLPFGGFVRFANRIVG